MKVQVNKIWYNPADAAFEGRVDVSRNGQTFRYPCAVPGPMTMPSKDVRARMEAQATRMTDSNPSIFSYI